MYDVGEKVSVAGNNNNNNNAPTLFCMINIIIRLSTE